MKLQSFSLSLLLLSMFWNQCFSAASCKMAYWWGTFDHKGWSTCDSSTEYIKGLWRNDPSGDDQISLLEKAKCCSAPTPYESMASTCQTANWWEVLDGDDVWAVCPTGYFLQGLWRNDGAGWIYEIEEAQCCKPNTLPDQYKDCYNENIWGSFDHKGVSECKADGYYVAGFYKSGCENLHCIEELKCCRMMADICKNANPCKNGGTCGAVSFGDGYICKCPSGYRGKTCELDICKYANPCKNRGTCRAVSFGDGYICECPSGYRGKTCELDSCKHANPCKNGGTCKAVSFGDGYICECPSGYHGKTCELDICKYAIPCKNGGTCGAVSFGDGYICECPSGYHGNTCEFASGK